MLHALLVEDNDAHASHVAASLSGVAHVQRVTHADEAIGVLSWVVPDVVITDLRGTCSVSPIEAAASLRIALDAAGARARVRAPLPLVIASALDPHVLDGIAGALANTHAIPKPFSRNDLRAVVARVTGVTP